MKQSTYLHPIVRAALGQPLYSEITRIEAARLVREYKQRRALGVSCDAHGRRWYDLLSVDRSQVRYQICVQAKRPKTEVIGAMHRVRSDALIPECLGCGSLADGFRKPCPAYVKQVREAFKAMKATP